MAAAEAVEEISAEEESALNDNFESGEACADTMKEMETNNKNIKNEIENSEKTNNNSAVNNEVSTSIEKLKESGTSGKISEAVEETAESLGLDSEEVSSASKKITENGVGYDENGRLIDGGMVPDELSDTRSHINDKTSNLTDSEKSSYTKYVKKISGLFKKKANLTEIPERSKGILKKDLSEWEKDDVKNLNEDLEQFSKDNASKLEELEKKASDKNALKGEPKAESKWKTIGKLIGALELVGGIAAALYILISYASAHSGCMKIEGGGSEHETQTKVFCSGGATDSPVTFNALQCGCSTQQETHKDCPTGDDENTSDTPTPPFVTNSSNPICKNQPSLENSDMSSSYVYYSYKVMSPAGAAIDIAHKAVNIVEDTANILLKVLMYSGIVIGSLIILVIILKLVQYFIRKKSNVTATANFSRRYY